MLRNAAGHGLSELVGMVAAEDILSRAQVASKRQALSLLAEQAARSFAAPAALVLRKLQEREAAGGTGFGDGVAMPHAFLPGLTGMRAIFMRLDRGVDFGAVDDRPVDLLFALFGPPAAGAAHLQALARVSRVLRRPEVRAALRQPRHLAQLRALFDPAPGSHAA